MLYFPSQFNPEAHRTLSESCARGLLPPPPSEACACLIHQPLSRQQLYYKPVYTNCNIWLPSLNQTPTWFNGFGLEYFISYFFVSSFFFLISSPFWPVLSPPGDCPVAYRDDYTSGCLWISIHWPIYHIGDPFWISLRPSC